MHITLIRKKSDGRRTLSLCAFPKFLERIAHDNSRQQIQKFRLAAPLLEGDYDHFETLHRFPRIYPAAEYKADQNRNMLFKKCNGLVALTFRDSKNPDFIPLAKAAVSQMPSTFAAFTGSDGFSLFLLVRFLQSDGSLPADESKAIRLYQAAYRKSADIYSVLMPGQLVETSPALDNFFLWTVDSSPYYNPDASALRIDPSLCIAKGQKPQAYTNFKRFHDLEYLYCTLSAEVSARMHTEGMVMDDSDPRPFLSALSERLYRANFSEEEAYLHLRHHWWTKMNEEELRILLRTVYEGLSGTPVSPLSLTRRDHIQHMIQHLKKRYVFRYNTVMKYTEYRPNNSWMNEFRPADPRVQKRMTLETQLEGHNVSIKDVRNFLESDYIMDYNPVQEYLFKCQGKWDGTDHIRRLASTVSTTCPHWTEWFYTWFLAMVNQWQSGIHSQYGNSVAPLLISGQGFHKSTFCRNLIPKELQWGYTDNLQFNEKHRVLQAMSQFLLINLDEFNQISPQVQQGFLKNIIQLASVKMKRPYGSHVEDFPRLASFIATSNMSDILSDPSGNRRFIGIELTAPIDLSVRPNHTQLYAQAMEALYNDEPCYFDARQTQLIMHHNLQFKRENPIELFFHEYFRAVDKESEGQYMTTTAIFEYLKSKVGSGLQIGNLFYFGRMLRNVPRMRHRKGEYGTEYLVALLK